MLEISDLGSRQDCCIYLAKTKALISCMVTAQLICIFVFAFAKKNRFSHEADHMVPFLLQDPPPLTYKRGEVITLPVKRKFESIEISPEVSLVKRTFSFHCWHKG